MAENQTEKTVTESPLPHQPIHRLTKPLKRFLHIEAVSGVVLLLSTLVALFLANSPWSDSFLAIWKTEVGLSIGDYEFRHSLKHFINDGLMVLFFFVVGLEVKREVVLGDLRELRRAVLPAAAALGGMLVPALVYLALQFRGEAVRGWGVPMATDIAFVVGCLAVLGNRVPPSLRAMLLSLAIVDDIGAILVIAVAYSSDIAFGWLLGGLGGALALLGFRRLGIRSMGVYTLAGVAIWFAFHESGVHATLAGVLLGLITPTRPYLKPGMLGPFFHDVGVLFLGAENEQSEPPNRKHGAKEARELKRVARETVAPLEYLENLLHPWVSYVVIPLFALANAGVKVNPSDVLSPVALAIIAGLVVGKPLGILLLSWLTVKTRIGELPRETSWRMIVGGGCLAGIGFTMALFIAGLALEGEQLTQAKIGILAASLISAVIGMSILFPGQSQEQQ